MGKISYSGIATEKWPYRLALGVSVYSFLCLALFYYFPSGTDDAFISLWAGEQLALGRGFINHNGEPLEICSSIFHACLIALFALVAPDHVFTLNKVSGMLAGAGVLCVIHLYRDTLFRRCASPILTYALCQVALALSPAFLYWTMGGLETPYASLLLTLYGCSLTRFWRSPAMSTAWLCGGVQLLYATVRPEGFFVFLFAWIFAGLYVYIKGGDRRLTIVLLPPLVAYAALALFRWLSFGMLLPNPVYAKTGSPLDHFGKGLSYLLSYFSGSYFAVLQLLVLAVLTVVYGRSLVLALLRPRDPRASERMEEVFLYGLCVASLLVVAFSGGDWMAHSRFVVPSIPCLTIVTIRGVALCEQRWGGAMPTRPWTHARTFLLVGVMAVFIGLNLGRVGPDPFPMLGMKPIRQEGGALQPYKLLRALASGSDLETRLIGLSARYRKELERVSPIYHELAPRILARKGKLTIVTPQMGIFPYMLKKRFPDEDIYFVDLKGLCTREIPRMDLSRSAGGTHANDLTAIFPANDSPLSRFVMGKDPDIVFVHVMDGAEKAALQRSGFAVLETKIGRHIAYRP